MASGAITLAALLAVPELTSGGRAVAGRDDIIYLGFAGDHRDARRAEHVQRQALADLRGRRKIGISTTRAIEYTLDLEEARLGPG